MQNTENLLLETLREISASNKLMAMTLNKALKLAEDNQINFETLRPISTEIYAQLHGKSEWTEEEEYWHTELRKSLTGREDN